jgi:flagellar hook-associated protein FlgK
MSLSLSLNNALSGLRANQKSLSVLSHNISNANTDGYSRQIVDQSALYIEGVGSGVRIDDVVRKVDQYLQRTVITQGSTVASANVVNEYYQRIQVAMGQPGSGNSIDEFMTSFFNAAQTLASTPDRSSARSELVSSASTLANEISGIAYDLEDLRFEADREIRDSVDAVNSLLDKLHKLNSSITSAGATGNSTAGLLDERDKALKELSGYMNISTSYSNYGAVHVVAGNGVALVDDTRHQLSYSGMQSADNFVSGSKLNPLVVYDLDAAGNRVGLPKEIISGSDANGVVTSGLTGGSIEGLRLMRDELIPAMLDQFDQLASNLRDAVNAVHNDGSGFPAATSLTGTRAITASQDFNWTGQVRIAVLQADGSPVPSGYADEAYTGIRPLTLDLGALNSGTGDGHPTMQSIVDEINQYFAAPGYKTTLGNLNNVKLVSDTDRLSLGVGSTFNFDLELENISGDPATTFVTNIRVNDASGADITSVTQPAPQITLNPAGAYTTTFGSDLVQLNLTATSGLSVGDRFYLAAPSGPDVGGIPAADVTGFFVVESVSGSTVTFRAASAATTAGTVTQPDAGGVYINPPYDTVAGGEVSRTRSNGEMQVNLSASPTSAYYDITVTVNTFDEDGVMHSSDITYRVRNGQTNLRNDRYDSIAANGDATRVMPQTTQDALRAILVDENGAEIRKVNGVYVDQNPSYLKLVSSNPNYTVAIDEMNSQQLGELQDVPNQAGTNWGFSHFFGLNDFFAPNAQSNTGDTVKGSALNLRVEQRLIDNPNLVTTGDLVLQNQPVSENDPPQWTYVRYAGDNQLATRFAALSTSTLVFQSAGGLPTIGLTLNGYASELLSFNAAKAAAAGDTLENAQTLYDGYNTRAQAISGVNLDEELANTVIFQNSYAATARIITIVNQMFDDILQMV